MSPSDWSIQSSLDLNLAFIRDALIGPQSLQEIILYVCDFQQLRYLVVEELLVLPAHARGRNTSITLRPTKESDSILDADGEVRLGEVGFVPARPQRTCSDGCRSDTRGPRGWGRSLQVS